MEQVNEFNALAVRKSPRLWLAVLLLGIALTGVSCKPWSDRPELQINKTLSELPDLVKAAAAYAPPYETTRIFSIKSLSAASSATIIEDCVRTLVLVGSPNKAIEAARGLRQADEKSWLRYMATSMIVKLLSRSGRKDEARRIAREEIEAAQKIEDARSRSKATAKIVIALAEAGWGNDAFEASRKIEYAYLREEALGYAAKAKAADGRSGEALEVARSIKDMSERSSALRMIVESLADSGKTGEAKQVAKEALELAREIVNLHLQSAGRDPGSAVLNVGKIEQCHMSLVNIFGALNKAGIRDKAEWICREALKPGPNGNYEHARSPAIEQLAEALAEAGQHKMALEAAQKVIHVREQQWTLARIVAVLVRKGQCEEALEVGWKIGDPDLRSEALDKIAAALDKAGKHLETPEAAQKLEDVGFRSRMLVKSGRSKEAQQAAEEWLEAARKIMLSSRREESLIGVAEALAEAGKSGKALEAAREIEDAKFRFEALIKAGRAITRGHDRDRARDVIEEARRTIERISGYAPKSRAFAMVAESLANLHFYGLARQAVEHDTSPVDKVAAYTVILREYHIERNPDLAKLFEDATGSSH